MWGAMKRADDHSDLKISMINFSHVLVPSYIPSPNPEYYPVPFARKCVPGVDVGDPDRFPEAYIPFKLGTKLGADQAFHIVTSRRAETLSNEKKRTLCLDGTCYAKRRSGNASVAYISLQSSVRYGVTANIAAFHVTLARGSSGFDSPYRSLFFLIQLLVPCFSLLLDLRSGSA